MRSSHGMVVLDGEMTVPSRRRWSSRAGRRLVPGLRRSGGGQRPCRRLLLSSRNESLRASTFAATLWNEPTVLRSPSVSRLRLRAIGQRGAWGRSMRLATIMSFRPRHFLKKRLGLESVSAPWPRHRPPKTIQPLTNNSCTPAINGWMRRRDNHCAPEPQRPHRPVAHIGLVDR